MSMRKVQRSLSLIVSAIAISGCAGGEGGPDNLDAPVVLAVPKAEVSVGDDIEVIGGNFVASASVQTELRLVGDYLADNGASYAVDYRVKPHWEDGNRVVWAFFGPYDIPFSPTGDELGTFSGDIYAINVHRETGVEIESDPLALDLRVGPSIIIRDFQPVDADCSKRPNVILAGFDYRMDVEAVGFEPVNFSFVIAGEPTSTGPRVFRQPALGARASWGDEGGFFFERVPQEVPFYLASLGVASLDTKGRQHILSLDFGVHTPIEHIQTGKVKVAEIMEAAPVSGCISGGETNGRTVTYTEQETDTRSRTVGVNWNQEWREEVSETQGTSTTETNGVSVEVSESETVGTEWGWEDGRDISGGGNAGGSLFGVVEVGVSGEYKDIHREHRSWNASRTVGRTVGRSYSRSDTESWAFTQTIGQSVSQGGSDFWTIESSSSTIVSFEGLILPGEYGVFYRQTTRLAIPGAVVSYNLCGEPEIVAETNFYDYAWSVDLAQGAECPPFPESSLPEAQCLIAPCEQQ
jgi:hypothetical protein